MTLRINRTDTPERVVFTLIGDMDLEHATGLQEFVAVEPADRVILDLLDVILVHRAAVQVLARLEAGGIRLVNCPEYVRRWIAAEQDGSTN